MTTSAAAKPPPFRRVDWLARDIAVERRPDGVIVMASRIPLQPYARHLPEVLARWAQERPDHVWLAQRRGADRRWREVTFGEAKRTVDALTQALLDLGDVGGRPLAILGANSLEHALMTMAAMQARLPAAPISPAYSLMSRDHAELKYIFELIRPAVVMVQDGPAFDKALAALDLTGVTLVHVERPPSGRASAAYADLAATAVTPAVEASIAAITPQTVGKLLFTSGSTGRPKAVINTQRMMCANVAMEMQARNDWPSYSIYLDWMPWSHTMAGNALFNPVLVQGSAFYIDDGRPLPGQFEETLRNLHEIAPSYYHNVPTGYAALAAAMEADDTLCRNFFKNLGLIAYGGARLPDDLYDRIQALAIRATGERIVFYTAWGATETGPMATSTYWNTERVGLIGLPFPGIELKLVPIGPKYEVLLRGISVTPGYFGRPDLTAAAFDEEGFFRVGDAVTFADPDDPAEGLVFAGRVVEDFKLATGTFVQGGALRTDAIAWATPVIQDALVTGQDRPYVGLLAWPNLAACRRLIGDPSATLDAVVAHPTVVARVREGLAAHNGRVGHASSLRIARVMLMTEPPSIDGQELTDKGYINQRAGLERRAALVERLYREPPADDVIMIE